MDATGQERFAALVDLLTARPGVTGPVPGARGFGATGIRLDGKVVAMLGRTDASRGRLVVKLPPERVDELVRAGAGHPFSSGGRRMRGWLVVVDDEQQWHALAQEALAAGEDAGSSR